MEGRLWMTPDERKALNEGTFRDANERLEQSARAIVGSGDAALVPFLCECPRPECRQVVMLALAEYETIRDDGRRGLAALGHQDLSIETVIDENDRFVTTEKFGAAGDFHAANDPRE
jgi:hypothetical protein